MNLKAITVCVNYADLLAKSLERWHTQTDRLVVVTAPKDHATRVLCDKHNVETFVTDLFYANGARFNKGAALSQAAITTGLRRYGEWMLTFDSDIIPPPDWRKRLNESKLVPGILYGAYRYWQPENVRQPVVDLAKKMPQSWVIGFFSLFHVRDPRLPVGPLFDCHWPHAGNYDTTFARRWPPDRQRILNELPMIHLGEERSNWAGRGNKLELQSEFLVRRSGHEDWKGEAMDNPPAVG